MSDLLPAAFGGALQALVPLLSIALVLGAAVAVVTTIGVVFAVSKQRREGLDTIDPRSKIDPTVSDVLGDW